MSRSSTSSSSSQRATVAKLWFTCGFVALALLGLDHVLFSSEFLWVSLSEALVESGGPCSTQRGKADSMLELIRESDAPRHMRRVLVIGSSRACQGWSPERVPDLGDRDPRHRMTFSKVAFGMLGPYELRSLSTQVHDVERVVVFLSEFDTHRPLFLIPGAGLGGAAALADLVGLAEFGFWWNHRETLLQLTAAALFHSYRHRELLMLAGLDGLRRFELGDRLANRKSKVNRLLLGKPTTRLLSKEDFETAKREIQAANSRRIPIGQYHQLRSITRGAHVAVQQALIENAFEAFAEAGARILVVETPLSPLGTRLFDPTIRTEFLDFIASLERRYPVDFIPLESLPKIHPESFADLTHLRPGSARDLTRAVLEWMSRGNR